MGSVKMRKLMSVSIVGVMMLTLIVGLFGGIFEDGRGEIVYDPLANTIYVNNTNSCEYYLCKQYKQFFI
jgi:hypothetical protein